jgi:hypothetical protein
MSFGSLQELSVLSTSVFFFKKMIDQPNFIHTGNMIFGKDIFRGNIHLNGNSRLSDNYALQ